MPATSQKLQDQKSRCLPRTGVNAVESNNANVGNTAIGGGANSVQGTSISNRNNQGQIINGRKLLVRLRSSSTSLLMARHCRQMSASDS